MAADLEPAANAAVNVYVELYEALCEEQQIEKAMGNPLKARRAAYNAHIVRAAIDAELHDPDSKDEPYRFCSDVRKCDACAWMTTRGVR